MATAVASANAPTPMTGIIYTGRDLLLLMGVRQELMSSTKKTLWTGSVRAEVRLNGPDEVKSDADGVVKV